MLTWISFKKETIFKDYVNKKNKQAYHVCAKEEQVIQTIVMKAL